MADIALESISPVLTVYPVPNESEPLGIAAPADGSPCQITLEEVRAPLNHSPIAPPGTPDSHLKDQATPVVLEMTESTSQESMALDSVVSPKTPGLYSRVASLMADLWVWEVLSCVLAAVCLVAIVAVLATHQNRPLPQWPNYISINSLIAIITAIMKASLMLPVAEGICQLKWLWFNTTDLRPLSMMENFDSASRGPWGALMLMVQPRKHYLASFGALITIVMLAVDAFSQQIIQYNNCMVVQLGVSAYLPRGNNYSGDAMSSHAGHAITSRRTAAAMSLGIMDLSTDSELLVRFGCSSGNCTFPAISGGAVFSTLGMCFEVKDISDQIHRNETDGTFWIPTRNSTFLPRVGFVNVSDSQQYTLMYSRKNLANSTEFDALITVDMLMLRIDGTTCDEANAEDCSKTPWAVRSSIIPCIKTYSANVTAGRLNEAVLSTALLKKTNVSSIDMDDNPNLTWSLATDTIIRNGQLHQCETSQNPSIRTPIAVSVNNTLALTPTDVVIYYETDCVWVVESLEALAQNQLLSWQWDVEWLQNWSENPFTAQGSDWLTSFYNNGTATLQTSRVYMERLATVMTTMMREHGPATRYVQGDVLMAQTCIGINWTWIALPVIMILSVTGFLAATMFLASADGSLRGAWRSSALAPFFHGLAEEMEATTVHSLWSKSGMEELGKTVHVRMVDRFGEKVLVSCGSE